MQSTQSKLMPQEISAPLPPPIAGRRRGTRERAPQPRWTSQTACDAPTPVNTRRKRSGCRRWVQRPSPNAYSSGAAKSNLASIRACLLSKLGVTTLRRKRPPSASCRASIRRARISALITMLNTRGTKSVRSRAPRSRRARRRDLAASRAPAARRCSAPSRAGMSRPIGGVAAGHVEAAVELAGHIVERTLSRCAPGAPCSRPRGSPCRPSAS